jgi:hypothetical protein
MIDKGGTSKVDLDADLRQKIANLPDEGLELDRNFVAGIIGRYQLARELLCVLLAQPERSTEESLLLEAAQLLVEKDVPTMLRSIAGIR